MKILLLGKDGRIGWELQRSLASIGTLIAPDRQDAEHPLDLSRPDQLARSVRAMQPDIIVNAAAYTAVDRAEAEPALAMRVNAEAPAVLAAQAAALGAWLVHYSTDYVFDGSGTEPRDEEAATAPLNAYGRSKLEGELRIRASACRHLILRTGWIHADRGSNFARTMIGLAAERDRLQVVDDQIGAPTGADLSADIRAHLLRGVCADAQLGGTYHAVAAGETSWHGYACKVIDWARTNGLPMRVSPNAIEAVPSAMFPAPARRPANSRLSTRKLRERFGLALPTWQCGVERMLAEAFVRPQQPSATTEGH